MTTVDHSYEQALIMHDNVHIHVIMNIIMTPTSSSPQSSTSPPLLGVSVVEELAKGAGIIGILLPPKTYSVPVAKLLQTLQQIKMF